VTDNPAVLDESAIGYKGWRVAGAAAVGVFFAASLAYGFSVLLKPIAEELAWSRETASTAYACLAIATGVTAPLVGRLIDRHGTLRVVMPSIGVFGVGIASMAWLTPSKVHAYVLFTVLGLAVIGTAPLAYSRAVSTWFDRRRGLALAIMISGAAVASMTHPPMVAALIEIVGWRGACLILGGLVLGVGLPLVGGFVRDRSADRLAPVETGGATVSQALRSWIFWLLVVAVLAAAIAFNAVVVHVVALLTDRGIAPASAALAVSVMGAAGLAGRLLTGWLIDRFRATVVSAALMATAGVGIILLASAPSFAAAAVAAALIGFGMGGELDVTPFLLSRYFGLRSLTALYGWIWTTMGAGAAIGSVAMGRAFDASGSYERILLGIAAMTMIAGALMLTLPGYQGRVTVSAPLPSARGESPTPRDRDT
jgi:predicted MFS family arabinose efflux permease